jgi:hypothetical protein
MMYPVSRHFAYAAVIGLGIIPATVARAEDEDRNDFVQTNLVSDIPGLATITDPELLNPWGVSHSPISAVWVSNQATSTSTLYSVTDETKVSKVNLTVAIPKTAQGPQGPTGQVNNANAASFPVGNGGDGGSALFIFANLNGTISAWNTGPTAFIQATTPGAVYTGLASQRSTNAPLRRQWRGKRQRRRLRQLIRPAEPRGRRIRRPLAADRACPV